MKQVGINMDDSLAEELDELKRRRDAESDQTVSRSMVGSEAIALGLVAAEYFDEIEDAPESVRDRRAWLRQILIDHEE